MIRHAHLYFSRWTSESRAWRAGQQAISDGLADHVDYVGPGADGLPREQDIGGQQRIIRIGPMPPAPGSPPWQRALGLPRWYQAVRQHDFDGLELVIAHSLASLPAGILLARRHGVPLLYDAHELESEREGWGPAVRKVARLSEKLMLGQVDHVITVNDSIADWYRAAYPAASVSVVRNVPEPPASLAPSNLRSTLGIAPDAIVYCYCGQLGLGRGIEMLIDAFAMLGEQHHLALIGGGPRVEEYQRLAAAIPNVHLHPVVPHHQLISLLSGADVGIWINSGSSRSYWLALPNKVFEYAAAGLGLCLGPGPELDRVAATYPAVRRISADTASIAEMARGWTPAALERERAMIRPEHQVSWVTEKHRLSEAVQTALHRGRLRWSKSRIS